MRIKNYLLLSALMSSPWAAFAQTDMTSKIINPSFENGGLDGWTSNNMKTQTNTSFTLKDGSTYVEKWVNRGSYVGDGEVFQTIRKMPAGNYRLTLAAQNIQEGSPSSSQNGCVLFANDKTTKIDVRKNYTLEFTSIAGDMTIGFRAKGATGNWMALDNFKLEFLGRDYAAIAAELQKLIDEAKAALDNSEAANKADYQKAIDDAQKVCDNTESTDDEIASVVAALSAAGFNSRLANPTGAVPTVVTDTRYARGATQAFGRSRITTNGASIMEQGFCWSESKEPTVADNRSTDYFDNNGRIFVMKNLKPATVYYVRAYAITNGYAVGYGDPIKVITLPKGQITWSYDNGGSSDQNQRINAAVKEAVETYWNNLTNIAGFSTSVHYGAQTPTADCSYGGWMRVGPNASYQATGTIMHEMLHGIGVGTHEKWAQLKPSTWSGDRTNNLLKFWDNDNNAVLKGDGTHMWPYGINGAHEDDHTAKLYTITSLIAQSLGEDGLPCSDQRGYASPSYQFEQEDNVKYYIKNEDSSRGLGDSYLAEDADNHLVWRTIDADKAVANDSLAWYVTFTPGNQYYQLRNAATGRYISYISTGTNGFRTVARTAPATNDNLQLMRSRTDVKISGATGVRGYWMIHPQNNTATPVVFNAGANHTTNTASFNINDNATQQRWIFMTGDEAQKLEKNLVAFSRQELDDVVAQIRKLAETPHTEDIADVDKNLDNSLADITAKAAATDKASDIAALTTQARQAGNTFLGNATPLSVAEPFDLTFMITNPAFTTSSTEGWNASVAPGYDYKENEYYQTGFDFYQEIGFLPAGSYQLCVQAFQRPGEFDAVNKAWNNGLNNVNTFLYMGAKSLAVKNIMADPLPTIQWNGTMADKQTTDGKYVPNSMAGAARYFEKGNYDNKLTTTLTANAEKTKIGIRCGYTSGGYWSLFDNFRLYYFGSMNVDTITAIKNVSNTKVAAGHIFNLMGVDLGTDASRLAPGMYIMNGKKFIVR